MGLSWLYKTAATPAAMAPASKSPFFTDTDSAPLPVDAEPELELVADAELDDPLPDVVEEALLDPAAPKTPPWTVEGDEPCAF